jgi:hypothetical protein
MNFRYKYIFCLLFIVNLVNHRVIAQDVGDSLQVYDLQDTIVVVQSEYPAPGFHFIAGFDYRF